MVGARGSWHHRYRNRCAEPAKVPCVAPDACVPSARVANGWLDRLQHLFTGADGDGEKPHREKKDPLGERGENVAARELRNKGYRILTRNFKCVMGEIDIVARDGKTLVFVEVKT